MSKVYFASDHAGFKLKEELLAFVEGLGYEVHDLGPTTFVADDDYPDYVTPCAERVAADQGSFGVVIGWSGQGEGMAANRVQGIRATVFYGGSLDIITLGRHHNNANILSIGAGFVDEAAAKDAVKSFLETPFSAEERHMRRLAKF